MNKKDIRNKAICDERKAGKTYVEIGKKYNLSSNHARAICSNSEKFEQQSNDKLYRIISDAIEHRGLCQKVYFALIRNGITTPERLTELKPSDICKIRYIGDVSKKYILKMQEKLRGE